MASTEQSLTAAPRIERLRDFVVAIGELVETAPSEPDLLREGSRLLKELVGVDDWLPARYAAAAPLPATSNTCCTPIRGRGSPW